MKLSTLLVLFIASVLSHSAFAELQVFPLRVVLSDKDRSAQISLRHKGTKKERYRITAVFYRMGQDGSMTLVEKTLPEEHNGSSLFRYSPRQVELEPNVEQVVRLMARMPADLAEGEYRCHLHFESMSDDDTTMVPGTTSSGAQMMLKARMAVAIPVIIKKGTTSSKVSLNSFKILKDKDGKYSFSVEMLKEGNGFAYGTLEITATSAKGEIETVSTINGISTYIPKRTVSMPLSISSLPSGKIRMIFKDPNGADGEALASTEAVSIP